MIKIVNYGNSTAIKVKYKSYELSMMLEDRQKNHVSSIGFLPGKTCVVNICYNDCPMVALMHRYKGMQRAWTNNTEFILYNAEIFFNVLAEIFYNVKNKHFQINTSGDFLFQAWFDKWCNLVRCYPNIKFLAYTKNYLLNITELPQNLILVQSTYPGLELPQGNLPKAFLIHPLENRVPSNTIKCSNPPINMPSSCTRCFDLKNGESISMQYVNPRKLLRDCREKM